MERMPKPAVQKISFFTYLIPEDLILTWYNVNNYELPGLADSWETMERNTTQVFSQVDFKVVQSNWLAEDPVLLDEIRNTGSVDLQTAVGTIVPSLPNHSIFLA